MSYDEIDIHLNISRDMDEQYDLEHQMKYCFPVSFVKAQDLLCSVNNYINKKGIFSSDKRRFENIGRALIALDAGLDMDSSNLMPVEYSLEIMNSSKKDRMIWFLNIYSITFPSAVLEYKTLNIILKNIDSNFFERGKSLCKRGL